MEQPPDQAARPHEPATRRCPTAEIVYYVASSLDGFIATEDGGVEWLEPFEASGTDYGFGAFYSGVDALVMGSRTYEQTLTFGPSPYADKPLLVLSSRTLAASDGVEVADLEPATAVGRLSESGASRIWLVGGGELAGSFAREGLLDVLIVSIMPVLLGTGVPLLGRDGVRAYLALERTERIGDVVQSTYRRVDAP